MKAVLHLFGRTVSENTTPPLENSSISYSDFYTGTFDEFRNRRLESLTFQDSTFHSVVLPSFIRDNSNPVVLLQSTENNPPPSGLLSFLEDGFARMPSGSSSSSYTAGISRPVMATAPDALPHYGPPFRSRSRAISAEFDDRNAAELSSPSIPANSLSLRGAASAGPRGLGGSTVAATPLGQIAPRTANQRVLANARSENVHLPFTGTTLTCPSSSRQPYSPALVLPRPRHSSTALAEAQDSGTPRAGSFTSTAPTFPALFRPTVAVAAALQNEASLPISASFERLPTQSSLAESGTEPKKSCGAVFLRRLCCCHGDRLVSCRTASRCVLG